MRAGLGRRDQPRRRVSPRLAWGFDKRSDQTYVTLVHLGESLLRGVLHILCQREFILASPLTLPSPLNHHECDYQNGETNPW